MTFGAVLGELTREPAPDDWAVTKFNLGDTLLTISVGEKRKAQLKEAETAYRAPRLEQITREQAPPDWAAVNPGIPLFLRLDQREAKQRGRGRRGRRIARSTTTATRRSRGYVVLIAR